MTQVSHYNTSNQTRKQKVVVFVKPIWKSAMQKKRNCTSFKAIRMSSRCLKLRKKTNKQNKIDVVFVWKIGKENVQHFGKNKSCFWCKQKLKKMYCILVKIISSAHLTEPSCWLCHRSLGSYLCTQACLVPKQIHRNDQLIHSHCQKAALRHHANLVIEGMVKHQPELLPGHVRVGVHHLEPIHVPVEGYKWKVRKTTSWFMCGFELYMMASLTWQTPRPSWLFFQRQIDHSWAHRRLQHPQTSLPVNW